MGLLFMNLSQFTDKLNQDNPNQTEQNLTFAVLKYIESHYKDGTLTEIAETLKQRKLQQAAYLLLQTSLSADAILESIGYDNSSYFYRKFREKYGCSPKEYRKTH